MPKVDITVMRTPEQNAIGYFPTDRPQREKNGWTADASLSAEQMLFNFTPENSYREWLRNICKALNDKGQLPGIIPTAGWGYHWGDISAWYYTYLAGMRINPTARDVNEVDIAPLFPQDVNQVDAAHILPAGKLQVAWTRTGDVVELSISAPAALHGCISLPVGWRFADGDTQKTLQSGKYTMYNRA